MEKKRTQEKKERRLKSLEQSASVHPVVFNVLEKQLAFYRALFDAANEAVFIHDGRHGRIVDANQKALKIFGYAKEEIVQLDIWNFFEGDSATIQAETRERIQRAARGEAFHFETRARKKNGDLFWVEVNFKVTAFDDEERLVIIIRDISARKQAEKEFERIEELSNSIQRLGKIGAWEWDINRQKGFWTKEVFRIYDIDQDPGDQDLGHALEKILNCFHDNDLPVIRSAFYGCVEEGIPFSLEFQITTVKGRRIWIQARAKRINGQKDGSRIIGYIMDITGRKLNEETLRSEEKKYKTILQTAVDGFWLADLQGRILEVNDAYCQMSGYSEKELLSMSIPDLEGTLTPDEVGSRIEGVIRGGHDRFETKHRRKDGRPYDVEVSVQYLSNEDGRVVIFIRDISRFKTAEKEKAELQAQLNQAQKMDSIGRLAGGVAHDLNNLLSPILGYTQMLIDDANGATSQQTKMHSIYKAASGARDLVSQLLAFSRKQTLDFQIVDVDQILKDFEMLLRRTIREDIEIKVVSSSGLKTTMADVGKLEQIIMNLSVNAADAMPDGGSLTIETDIVRLDEKYASTYPDVRPGRYVLMSFADTGHGMDQDTRNKVFEPFFSTKGKQGTGLGLATVYGIVKQHEGHILVYSELEKGTVFKIYLPLILGKGTSVAKRTEPVADLRGTENILIAEDNAALRNLAAEVLTNSGYTVYTAGNGNEALESWAAIDEPIHLLITDVIMPEMNGKELFHSLNSLDPDIKVIYMSGYTGNVIAHHGVLESDIQYIQKPFNVTDLLSKVRKVLDSK